MTYVPDQLFQQGPFLRDHVVPIDVAPMALVQRQGRRVVGAGQVEAARQRAAQPLHAGGRTVDMAGNQARSLLQRRQRVAQFLFGGHEYDYREGVSVWFRQFWSFHPDPELTDAAPLSFQLHLLVACALFALWPFTRLVHVFSAPVGYMTRPYIVYRSRDEQLGQHRVRRGWEQVP